MQRQRQRRTILLAIVASLLLHLVVAISLAAFGGKLQPAPLEEEKPVELTFIDSTPTPAPLALAPKNAPFVETSEKRETAATPTEKTFESNANSIAASQQPAKGDAPIPTAEGRNLPSLDFEAQRYSLANTGHEAKPEPSRPSPAPTVRPSPTAPPTPTATPEAEQFAMLRATPPPPLVHTEEATPTPEIPTPPPSERPTPAQPQTPAAAYRREQVPTRMAGNISNRGVASVNAVGTPLGKYSKMVYDAVGSRWYSLVQQNSDRVNIGTVMIAFTVDRSGRITKISIRSNTADESFSNLCLQSVQDAKLPRMSDDVAAALPPEGLQEEVNFTIFPNR